MSFVKENKLKSTIKMKSIFVVTLICVLWLSVMPVMAFDRTVKPITPKALRNLSLAQQFIDDKAFDAAIKELSTLQAGEARIKSP